MLRFPLDRCAPVHALRSFGCACRDAALGLVLVASALAPAPAHAGPVEQLVGVAFGPEAEPSVIARYINGGGGVIQRASGERSWRLQCDSALVPEGVRGTSALLALADGTLLVATQRGVVAGPIGGCDYREETLAEPGEVIELVPDPRDPNAAFALVLLPSTPSFHTSLQHRSASGEWRVFGKDDLHVIATGLRVAAYGRGLRIYQTALIANRDDDAGPRYFTYNLRVSDDNGQRYEHRVISTTGEPRIIGVDPNQPDHVALLIDELSKPDLVLVSLDAGKTRAPYLELGSFGGAAFASDGRLWIGGSASGDHTEQGVWAAASLASPPSRLASSDYPVQCLGYHEGSGKLFACQHFWLGEVDANSGSFTTDLSFANVADFIGCDEPSTAARCEAQLCADYCGPAHFAVAPVCDAYDTPNCGRPVARAEGGNLPPGDTADAAPPSAAPATPATPIDAGVDAAPAFHGGSLPPATAPAGDDGGCAVLAVGRQRSGAGWLLAWLGLCCWWRRRVTACR